MLSVLLLSAAKSLPGSLLCAALGLLSYSPAAPGRPAARSRPVARPAAVRQQTAPRPLCTLTNDTLAGQPFGAEPTVAELIRAGGRIVSRRPFANLHIAGQTDTVLVLQHQGNEFEFYRTFEKDLLRQAVITNFRPAYGQRLRATLNESARRNGGPCRQLRLRDTERANNVSATFTAGQPSLAHVQPYWD